MEHILPMSERPDYIKESRLELLADPSRLRTKTTVNKCSKTHPEFNLLLHLKDIPEQHAFIHQI